MKAFHMFHRFADIEFDPSIWEQYVGYYFRFWFVATDIIFHLDYVYGIDLL